MRLRFCSSVAFAIALLGCGGDGGNGDSGTTDASSSSSTSSSGSDSSESSSSTGPVACPNEDWVRCDGICVDIETDVMNCGECDNVLPPDIDCVSGEPDCLLQGFDFCDGECVDILNDDENCGGCGNSCGDGDCAGNGCCQVRVDTTRPMSCMEVCADAGMTCECPRYGLASYDGECGLDAINFAACEDVPAVMVTCGTDPDTCDCALERIDCGCRP